VETDSESFTFEVAAEPPFVEVRIDRGPLVVTSSRSGRIDLEVRKTAKAADREAARALLDTVDVEVRELDRGLRIESRAGSGSLLGDTVTTELRLRVPASTDLDLRTDDGSVRVEGIEGRLAVDSGDGRVELERVAGEIRVRTADGSIRGSELAGSVDARTDDGRVEIDGRLDALEAVTADGSIRVRVEGSEPRALASPWTLRTLDGSIRLELPSELSADVEASTSDGDIDAELERFTGSREEGRLRGRLGDGGALILLVTMDGSIHLEQR
jgi:DUF4097 and DUF4098 domain-containing protein YvlB